MPSKRKSWALIAFLALSGCASAGAGLVSSIQRMSWTLDTKDLPSGRYRLDPDHASILFKVGHMGYAYYVGRFNKIEGVLDYDSLHPEKSRLSVTIEAASIDANHETLEQILRGRDHLDAERHPFIAYKADGLGIEDDRHGTVSGELTLREVARPVPLSVVFNGGASNPLTGRFTLGFSATASLSRSDFGMTALGPLVADRVDIEINVEFQREERNARS